MLTTLHDLMGTPQNPVNWINPADWIPERLQGSDRDQETAEYVAREFFPWLN